MRYRIFGLGLNGFDILIGERFDIQETNVALRRCHHQVVNSPTCD